MSVNKHSQMYCRSTTMFGLTTENGREFQSFQNTEIGGLIISLT